MKPYVVVHMMSSLDGRSLTDGWQMKFVFKLYEDTAARFEADAWICGRVTMQEVSHGDDYPKGLAKGPVPRVNRFVERAAKQYAISIDPHGRVAWKSNTALGSHVIEVLTEGVSDDYLAWLQSIGVSYVFGGKDEIDLPGVIQTLSSELGLKRLIVEGGSRVSGAFVNQRLVDEVSVLIVPLVDGRSEHPSSFEVEMNEWTAPAYLTLQSMEQLERGAVWLRYTVAAAP
ncbi:dihydrofolate reductase family protein [Caballeronia sp. LZ035]|uniref:dihydrofolate reductase family protein n=1 Tax=Caballeronia sp. LZ035 TaxID=3038568 RepID=UPI00285C1B34|nr:dihydrofolate reductase family protein [Caballeronia sp. LZ035]MDR5760829.1 dihydrofolate reductase family protein [Caballeronia sp. LZ035]